MRHRQSPDSFEELGSYYRELLLEDVIPFWLRCGWDREHGGVITTLNRQGVVIDSDKGVWQQGRFAWMMGHLYNHVERREEWLAAAVSGVEFLRRHCFDRDGRMFFQVTRDGLPIRKRRYAFSESFAAIAFGEVAQATGSGELAELAVDTYHSFRDHQPEPKFSSVRPLKGISKLMIEIVTCQMLRQSVGFNEADERIDSAIAEIRRDFVKPELGVCMEQVGLDGSVVDHLDGRLLNPGHALEAAWFIMMEGKLSGRGEYIDLGVQIADWMWQRGWDQEYGGILYFRDLYNHPVAEYWQDMKFWWPQNEGLLATLLAYQLTGAECQLERHQELREWYHNHMVDSEYGECYGYLSRDGRVSSDMKGNMYKGCFHYPRQLLYCWQWCREMGERAERKA